MGRRAVARRRRNASPEVSISGRASLRVKADNLQFELERELGFHHEQLELAVPTVPERSVITVRSTGGERVPQPTCAECGRRGYHLAACSRREVKR